MEETKKINLSAIMKKPHENEFNLTNEKGEHIESKTHPTVKAGVTINISSIKSDKVKEVEVIKEVEEVIKDEQTLFYESLTSNVLGKEKDKIVPKIKTIDLKSIKKSESNINENNKRKNTDSTCSMIIDDEGNEKEICNIQKHNSLKDDNKDLFSNYESDYKKKESIVIETIHKLKIIADIKKLTKTNKIFVVSIIMATIVGISFLFYIDPETHSLENYKASILTIAGREVTQQELLNHQTNIENNIKWQLNENRLGGYKLDFEILANENGEAIYKFDGLEYITKELLDVAITEKLKYLKKEKIKEYLKKQTEVSQ